MTVSTNTKKNTYSGDGTTVNFQFTFPILNQSNLLVQIENSAGVITTQTITTDYTVSGTGNDTGATNFDSGTVTFGTAPLNTDTVIILRAMPFLQETDYVENDEFPAESHEAALDELTMMALELAEKNDRTMLFPPTVTGFESTVPNPVPNGDKYLKVNAAGTAWEYQTLGSTAGLGNVSDDLTPSLGGDLDTAGFNISFDTSKGILDENGNEQLMFTTTSSAVNYLDVANAATATSPTLAAKGSDTDVGIAFQVKGNEAYSFLGTSSTSAAVRLYEDADNGSNFIALKAPDSVSSNTTLTLPGADGTSGQFLTTNGSATLAFSSTPPYPTLVKYATASNATYTSGTTSIPLDDTIPQSSEGTEILTATITPTASNSNLVITVTVPHSPSTANTLMMAVFRDSGASAVATYAQSTALNTYMMTTSFRFVVPASSTSATTFKLRVGTNAGTWYINGDSAGRKFGGIAAVNMIIEEWSA